MNRPKLLDLFCCAGGAGMGYHRAGFDVVGVDIAPQPDYPFDFIQADAVTFAYECGREFDAVHASPPCQPHSALTKGTNKGRQYADFVKETRLALWALNKPSVIENVQGAPIRRDLTLCGEMFGLGVIRHRYFELSGFTAEQPEHKPHRGRVRGWRHGQYFDGPYLAVHGEGGGKGTVTEWQQAMGIDWTSDRKHLAEAIPPAYRRVDRGSVARVVGSSSMTMQQDCNHICPECREGKHRNCTGTAWCDLMDAEVECACLDCEWGAA